MDIFKWKEPKPTPALKEEKEVAIIRILDTPYGEQIELYDEKGFILGGKVPQNEKEKTKYLTFLQSNYPKAKQEQVGIYDLDVEECPSKTIELYSFFPRQLERLIEKNLYDIYEQYIPVGIILHVEEEMYPVTFHIKEEDMEDTSIIAQIRADYWGEHQRDDEIFEAIIQDITGKKLHKLEIDESYGFKPDPNNWNNDHHNAYDFEAKLLVYVK